MRFAVLASGSRSNAIVINQSDTYLLIDCGLSQQKLISKLKNLGLEPVSYTHLTLPTSDLV